MQTFNSQKCYIVPFDGGYYPVLFLFFFCLFVLMLSKINHCVCMYLSHTELSSEIIFNNYKLKILLGHFQFYSNNWKSLG